jgi:hypothetical protein
VIRAYLAVDSTRVTAAEVTRRLGLEPTEVRERGARARVGLPGGRPHHSWHLHLPSTAAWFGGEDGLSATVEALGLGLADRLRRLAEDGCHVTVRIVQQVDDAVRDHLSIGLVLTPGALVWLAAARASIDLDQYLDPEARPVGPVTSGLPEGYRTVLFGEVDPRDGWALELWGGADGEQVAEVFEDEATHERTVRFLTDQPVPLGAVRHLLVEAERRL